MLLDFRNYKWQIQYDGKKFKESLDCAQNWYTGVFKVADHDFAIRLRIPKFEMAAKSSREA